MTANSRKILRIISILIIVSSNPLMLMIRYCGAQQQYFRIKPRNITVHEGGEALMECEIVHLTGAVQWAKDGFALGFGPMIPARPRYMVIEDRKQGIYSLRITNVSLEDDGEFQCQVGPFKINKAIRANARLSVISPPTNVEIVNYAPNSKIEIKENSELNLECVARNSKPAAKILWYRGNVPLNIEPSKVQIQEIEDNHGIKRFNVRSKITLKPLQEDDFVKYTCEARHDALFDHPIRTTVELSVLYPPSAPIIDGYTDGEIVKRGQIVELACRSRNGNPPAELIWYKNNTQVRMSYRTSGRQSENILTFSADASDDKSRYRCESQNYLSTKLLKAEIMMTVLFSPSFITIAGPTEAKIGEKIALTCKTANSNPPSEIKCTVAGKELRSIASRISASPDGGWFTTANISLVIEPNIKSFIVICHALNRQLNENIVGTHTVNVLHKPNPPNIEGYVSGTNLIAGSVQKLLCISSGGNPLATLTWFKNDKRIESVLSLTDKSVSAELTIIVNASDNNAVYRCEAINAAINSPFFDTVTLNVHFAAERLKIRTEPEILKPKIVARLVCESSSSNPASKLSWWHNDVPLLGFNETIELAPYGGKITRSELRLNISQKSNNDVFMCQATNEALQKNNHESVRLQVFYKPVIESSNDIFSGLENDSLSIQFKVHGNPSKISYTWTKDGLPIVSYPNTGRIISNGPVLNISKLSRNDIGVYVCEAINSEGRTLVNANVNVEYPAEIISISERIIVEQMGDARFTCIADGNPFDVNTISWKRDNFSDFESRATIDVQLMNKNSTLILKRVQKTDTGFYQCIANNGLGSISVRTAFLLIKHKPEIDMTLTMMKSASDIGDIGRLICRTRSFPIPSYLWSRTGLPITTNNTGKYFTTFKQIDELTSESALIITHVTDSDYGSYECIARNELGFITITLSLQTISVPDAPMELFASNVTHDSITLHWTPGFNGGLPLLYKIRYRTVTDSEYNYDNVIEQNVTNFTLLNLEPNSEYLISIAAINRVGSSNYFQDLLRVKTSNNIPSSYHSSSSSAEKLPAKVSSLLILLSSVVGTVLLLLNAMLIGCCLRRRSKRLSKAERTIKGNKAATIEMYAPSSFNETVTAGETLSSISEKSENISPEGSHNEFMDNDKKYTTASTYLVDQPDFRTSYQLFSNYDNYKTQTLPHLHNHMKYGDRSRSKDDLNINQYSVRSSFAATDSSPIPPSDGSYFNMAEYLSYPPSLELQPCSSTPSPATMPTVNASTLASHQSKLNHQPPHQNHIVYQHYPISTLLRRQKVVPPPDVLYGANNVAGVGTGQILQAQNLTTTMPMTLPSSKRVEFSSFGNGYILHEHDNHLV